MNRILKIFIMNFMWFLLYSSVYTVEHPVDGHTSDRNI
jgi:hypothetical protein